MQAGTTSDARLKLLVLPGLDLFLMIRLILLKLLVSWFCFRAGLVHHLQDGIEDASDVLPDAFIEIVQV